MVFQWALFYYDFLYFSAALNAYYAQMQMDSITRSSVASPLTTSTPAASSQGQPHILRKASRKRNKGDNNMHNQNDVVVRLRFFSFQIKICNYIPNVTHHHIFIFVVCFV